MTPSRTWRLAGYRSLQRDKRCTLKWRTHVQFELRCVLETTSLVYDTDASRLGVGISALVYATTENNVTPYRHLDLTPSSAPRSPRVHVPDLDSTFEPEKIQSAVASHSIT